MTEKKISFYDISKLIELNKEKAELQFKLLYALANTNSVSKETAVELESSIAKVSASHSFILSKLNAAGISFALPNENTINELSVQVNGFNPNDIIAAVKTKSGPTYELMGKRAVLVKKNYESRENIGKMLLLIANIGKKNKELSGKLLEAVKSGGNPLLASDISLLTPKELHHLGNLFHRVGLSFPDHKTVEVPIPMNHRVVWIDQKSSTDLLSNFDKIKSLSTKIQLRNAERQVKVFDDNEEKEFVELQHEYLKLLKEQDSILKSFNEEEIEFTH